MREAIPTRAGLTFEQLNGVIVGGRAHPEFTEKVADHLGCTPVQMKLGEHDCGEISVEIMESVRGKKAFVIQAHGGELLDTDKAIREHSDMLQAVGASSAIERTAVATILGYARQDRTKHGREALGAKNTIRQLEVIGSANRIVTMDMHSGQIQGFTRENIPFDHLTALPALVDDIKQRFAEKIETQSLIIGAADFGGATLAGKLQRELVLPPQNVLIVNKQRSQNTQSEGRITNETTASAIIGDVGRLKDSTTIFIEDMIDSGGTVRASSAIAKKEGAAEVYIYATHGIFSKDAKDRLEDDENIDGVVVTDTLPVNETEKIKVVSASELVALALYKIAANQSVSQVFKGTNRF